MNAKQFRIQYLLSLGLTFIAAIIFIAAILVFLFSSSQTVFNELSNPLSNSETVEKMVRELIVFLFVKSFYALAGAVLYIIGVFWNIIVAFMRANSQDDHTLTFVVVVGWMASILLPVVGLIISFVAQIWGWFQGSKDINPLVIKS